MTSHAERTPASPLRLAELLVPLSLVTDIGMGTPDGEAARACVLASELAVKMGLPSDAIADVYYTTLLKHLGCTATAHEEAAHLGGDELATRPLISRTDEARPSELLSLLRTIGADRSPLERGRIVLGTITGMRWGIEVQRAVCEVASVVAERLGMTPTVRSSLAQGFERWDGRGQPNQIKGDAIELPARFAHLATRALAFHELGGADVAIASVRDSRGGWLDPELVSAFEQYGPTLLEQIDEGDPLEAALRVEPQPWRTVEPRGVLEVARGFADMADLKSSFTLGHSPAVAQLVRDTAPRVGLSDSERADLEIAALLHDIGRVGVPSGVWEKGSRLTASDWERVRLHAYYSERTLVRSSQLAHLAPLVGMHHERLDGSGYHRGSRAPEISLASRLLAAADTYQAKTQSRPHRPALSPDAAADAIVREAAEGRLDPDVVAAIAEVAQGRVRRVARSAPAGLTDREVEVLRLVAEGCSNREIADRLVISTRTAEHHVQHIYEKIGLSTRAGATMFALQHELLIPDSQP